MTFNTFGGQPVPPDQDVDYGGYVERPIDPTIETPTGYSEASFANWYDLDNANLWDFNNSQVTNNLTLSAHFNSYREMPAYDEQGGTQIDTLNAYYSFADYGMSDYLFSPPADPEDPTGEGRTFLGWAYYLNGAEYMLDFSYTYPDTGEQGCASISTDATEICAVWGEPQPGEESAVVMFNAYGGTPEPPQQTVYWIEGEEGAYATEPIEPQVEPDESSTTYSYTNTGFRGWYDGVGNIWDFLNNLVSSDMDLYAGYSWTRTITVYDAQGGNIIDSVSAYHSFNTESNDYVLSVAIPATPSEPPAGHEGETFGGWGCIQDGDLAFISTGETYPDTGETGCMLIPENVDEIFAIWAD